MGDPTPKRKFSVSSTEEQNALVQLVVPKNTHNATQYWVRMLGQFCDERVESKVNMKTVPGEMLSGLLASFYADAKTKDGSGFSKNSLKCA